MKNSPISAVLSTFTESSTSNQQSTPISSAAPSVNRIDGTSQPNHELKLSPRSYEKPPSSETSNSV